MKYNYRFFMMVMFFIIFLSFDVLAYAITPFYWDEYPLYLNPGESKDIEAFGMQNMVGNEDIYIKVEQNSGLDIAKITDESTIYEIPFGRKDVMVHMRITIPKEATIGQVYDIGASFKETLKEDTGGSVQFSSGISNGIVVVVGKKVEEESGVVSEPVTETTAPKEEEPSEIISEIIKRDYSNLGILLVIFVLVLILLWYRHELKKNKKTRK